MQEATPDVMTPMCWSMWTAQGELGARRTWYQLGLLPKSMVRVPDDVNSLVMAPFFVRQAINVDWLATMTGALPGISRETVERDMMGTVRSDRPEQAAPRFRAPFVLVKAPSVLSTQTAKSKR